MRPTPRHAFFCLLLLFYLGTLGSLSIPRLMQFKKKTKKKKKTQRRRYRTFISSAWIPAR